MLLKNCVPGFITEEIEDFEVIYKIQQEEIDRLNKDIREALAQFFVYRATWGIKEWETFLGLVTDTTKQSEDRQASIIAKLRGQGTSTVQVIENVAQSFVKDGEVEVIEHNSENYFEIDLKSSTGFPYELKGLESAINEIKPAHLGMTYKLISTLNSNLYIGSMCLSGQKITVLPWQTKTLQSKTQINISPGINRGSNLIIVYPKEGGI